MMRRGLVTLAILLSSALLSAQQRQAAPPQPAPAPPPATTTFATPTPPPTILPQAPVMPPIVGGFTSGSQFPPQVNPAFSPGRPGLRPRPNSYGGSYFYAPYPPDSLASIVPPTVAPATGMLRLTGTPESAQVFVDGYYVATLGDIEAQRVLTLPVGPHRIEVRAPDYDTTSFDVRIQANETVTYRAVLEHVRPQPRAATPTSRGATKMYLIPNCYLGNIPPKAERLPRGCDIKRVQIIS